MMGDLSSILKVECKSVRGRYYILFCNTSYFAIQVMSKIFEKEDIKSKLRVQIYGKKNIRGIELF